jgi:hypothetical protein
MLERGLKGVAFVGLLIFALACAKTQDSHPSGTNTNWLETCRADADCDDGNSCLCGVCARPCQSGGQCEAFGATASCEPLSAAACGSAARPPAAAACLQECDSDDDCDAVEGGRCRSGVCLPAPAEPVGAGRGSAGQAGGAGGTTAQDASVPGPPIDLFFVTRNDRIVQYGGGWAECESDGDCSLVGIGCDGCCQFGAINADLVSDFQMRFTQACSDYRGGICDCQPQPQVARCRAGACMAEIVDVATTCYSPTQNLEIAYEPGAVGCACTTLESEICVGSTALICMRNAQQELVWTAVEDGPCQPSSVGCSDMAVRLTADECLAEFTSCYQLQPGGQFCGRRGCIEPLECAQQQSCAAYAPLDPEDCPNVLGVFEGTCDDGKIRYRFESGGFVSSTRYWSVATGELLATLETSDSPEFCAFTSSQLINGDPAFVALCRLAEDSRTRVCP